MIRVFVFDTSSLGDWQMKALTKTLCLLSPTTGMDASAPGDAGKRPLQRGCVGIIAGLSQWDYFVALLPLRNLGATCLQALLSVGSEDDMTFSFIFTKASWTRPVRTAYESGVTVKTHPLTFTTFGRPPICTMSATEPRDFVRRDLAS